MGIAYLDSCNYSNHNDNQKKTDQSLYLNDSIKNKDSIYQYKGFENFKEAVIISKDSIYLTFEADFKNDRVQIYSNKKLEYSNVITTETSSGIA